MQKDLHKQLVLEEIERIVAEARTEGATLRTGYHAELLAAAYPSCNFSLGRIIDELTLEATKHGVAVEIGRH